MTTSAGFHGSGEKRLMLLVIVVGWREVVMWWRRGAERGSGI